MSPDDHGSTTEHRYGRRATDKAPIELDPDLVHVLDIRRSARRGHFMRLLGYGALCIALLLGFVRVETQQYEICLHDNELRSTLRTFLREAYEADRAGISEGERVVLDIAERTLGEIDCPPVPWIFWE